MDKYQLINHSREIEIPENDPFHNCALGRKQYAKILTDVIMLYSQSGCVMSLNGEWGSGKTTFVKMWRQSLENEHFKTFYFNAWESDYVEDPIIAMLSEMQDLKADEEKYKDLIAKSGKLLISSFITFIKFLIKKHTGIDKGVVDDAMGDLSEIGKECIDDYKQQKASITEFKKALIEYVAFYTDEKPVVFFIDELDRCNPTFAVRVLERIKHLFDIPNIIFVLAVNKSQLQYAIEGYYGSSKMNSEEYMRRFIDVEYTLPTPSMEDFCNYLATQHDFQKFFNNPNRTRNVNYPDEQEYFLNIAATLFTNMHLSLRDADKVFTYARLVLCGVGDKIKLNIEVFFLLVFWRVMDSPFYESIRNHAYSIQDLLTQIEEKIPETLLTNNQNSYTCNITYTIASLLYSYNFNERGIEYDNSFKGETLEGNRVKSFPINSKFDKGELDKYLTMLESNYDPYRTLYPLFRYIDIVNRLIL